MHPSKVPSPQYILSTHPINTFSHYIISIHPLITPYQLTLSTHPINIPAHYILSLHYPLLSTGRTGRAGAKGVSISFFTDKASKMARELVTILREANQEIPAALNNRGGMGGGGGGSRYGGGGGGRGGGGRY